MSRNIVLIGLVFVVGVCVGAMAGYSGTAISASHVKLENLMRAELQIADGIEVIVSKVEIGPGTSLPKHHHPGEEFIYVLEGSGTMWQLGKQDTQLKAGDVFKVPVEQVHTAITGDESIKGVVFRVHRKGTPERVLAN